MKRKQENLPIPMQMLRDFEKDYPGCWNWIEHIRAGKCKDLPDWDDIVYIPLTGTNEILRNKYNSNDTNNGCLYAALASWRQYKEIYSFSPELVETLFAQADEDIVIPCDILRSMPFPCIYIETEHNKSGFFVYWEQDFNTQDMELRFTTIENENYGMKSEPHFSILNCWLHISPGFTIADGIRRGAELCDKNVRLRKATSTIPMTKDEITNFYTPLVSRLIQLVLYICAENAEVEENPETKPFTRKPAPGTQPKDVMREVRSWDVGVKFAYNFRKSQSTSNIPGSSSPGTGIGAPKRPHARRGHWHHYWTGSTKDGSRKLILKWTAPIFVGGSSDDTITTINPL